MIQKLQVILQRVLSAKNRFVDNFGRGVVLSFFIFHKANSTLGFIRSNVLTVSQDVKSSAYKQLVRPIMEYSSGAWDSISNTAAKCLEAVQRRAARVI